MINQQQRQPQPLLRCQLVKLQLVDLVHQQLVQQLQEGLEVPQHQQGSAHQAGVQHLALRQQQEASAAPAQVLVQHHQLERVRLGLAQADLEAHLVASGQAGVASAGE